MNVFQEVTQIVAAHLGAGAVGFRMGTELAQLGIDSIDRIEIVMDMEEHFGVKLSMEEAPYTIGDLVRLVPEK